MTQTVAALDAERDRLALRRRAILEGAQHRGLSPHEYDELERVQTRLDEIARQIHQAHDTEYSRQRVPDSQLSTTPIYDGRAAERVIDSGLGPSPTRASASGTLARELRDKMLLGALETGGFAVADEVAESVWRGAEAQAVLLRLGVRRVPMPEGGTLRLPRLTSRPQAGWIGEAGTIPTTQPTLGQVTVQRRKVAAITRMSSELAMIDTAAALCEDELRRALAREIDRAGIAGAGTEHEPKGLAHWGLDPLVVDAALRVVGLDPFAAALARLRGRGITPGAILMHPRTYEHILTIRDEAESQRPLLVSGRDGTPPMIYGLPIHVADAVPIVDDETSIYVGDFSAAVFASAPLRVGVDRSSRFATDEVEVRAIGYADLVVLGPEFIIELTGVDVSEPD